MFAYAFTFLIALAVTFVLTPLVKRLAVTVGAVDKPDARKVHHGLIPRLGGLAIYAGFMVSVIATVGFTYEITGIMIGATFLVLVGLPMISCRFLRKLNFWGRFFRRPFWSFSLMSISIGWICRG